MKPTITPLYLSLFLHILTLLVAGQSPAIYSPVDDITLACGNSGQQSTNFDRRIWIGDISSKYSPIEVGKSNTTSQFRKAPPSSSASQPPYTTARLSYSEFTYKIPLSPGQKFIRLHFNPATYNPDFDRSNSLFSVKAGGFTLLGDFNASVTADFYGGPPLIREFCVNVETEQSLNITFTPAKDAYAFINGIEIVSMPTSLYYTSSPKFIGRETSYAIGNGTALEMVYRINIGGSPISPNEDTGMYRNWEAADDQYLDEASKKFSVLPQNNTIKLNFTTIPEYSAPKAVYVTGRSMGMNKIINKNYNLTWVLPLDPKFYYLVRLHFCEFEGDIINYSDRSFQIYLANQTAEELADVIGWSGGTGIPVYRDYVVGMFMSPVGGQKKVDLFLVLSALQKDSYTSYNDAILNGLEIFKLNDSSHNLAGPNPDPIPVKTRPKPSPNSPNNGKSTPMAAIIAGVVSGLFVLSVLGFFVFWRGRKVKDSQAKWGMLSFSTTKSTQSYGSSLPSELCHHFSLAQIRAATQNFDDSNIIGLGGFGNVYKGTINGASTPVAIKRLKPESEQGALEFTTEIELLSQLRHLHLVSLVGYCDDNREMILVYDYMENGTLRDHLYNSKNPPLPWEQRLQACIGAARGLHYLHTGAKRKIIHRDVKSTNILLDDKWVAKVSDFGLSKMDTTTMSKTHISTMVKGSFGYLDPEYYRRHQLTEKSDVYSFGVVLCEVLCARPALMRTVEKKEMNLAAWAKTCHENGTLDQIIDPNLRGKIVNVCLNKFVEIAISCLHDNGNERPSMNDIVGGLEFALNLQQSAEGSDLDFNVEKKGDDEVPIMNSSDVVFSGIWEESSGSNSRVTKTSSSDQNSTASESIKGLSGTVFSEIYDPNGR
ncbi:hypothetical protein M0R45_033227 [Rubus argutus]|uniref:Protein kinase domain-containing protein n=1 Tax=Rubus argutus TaxID=59490 RepID=A0AAW1WMB0_RUBAR